MKDNINEIDTFIKKLIIEKQNLKIHTIENEIERPELKKRFFNSGLYSIQLQLINY